MAHQFYFGTGNIYILPSGGGTPLQVAAIQNASVNFDGDTKALYGQNQFPLDTARGKVKITGKFEVGQINSALWNAVFFGQTVTAGQTLQALNEGPAAIPTTPFQITAANGATFSQDLGVYYSASGLPLTAITTGTPAAGQYKLGTGGVYTFSSADNVSGYSAILNYEYGSSSTGKTLAVNNQLMGQMPVYSLHLNNNTKGKQSVLQLYACTSGKLDFPFKQDDYGLQSIDFMAQDDGTGRIFSWSTTEG
jgi:hypothetical protein